MINLKSTSTVKSGSIKMLAYGQAGSGKTSLIPTLPAPVILSAEGEMQTTMAEIIRSFRDLPRHILMTAKLEKAQDEMGRMLYSPSMPGNKTGQALPYYFDIVAALRVEKDAEGVTQRAMMLESDGMWQAKDRSGKLAAWEAPNLGEIIKKIGE
jgi:hypothetical protein